MIQPLVTKADHYSVRQWQQGNPTPEANRRTNYGHNAAFIEAENKTNNCDEWVQMVPVFVFYSIFIQIFIF